MDGIMFVPNEVQVLTLNVTVFGDKTFEVIKV